MPFCVQLQVKMLIPAIMALTMSWSLIAHSKDVITQTVVGSENEEKLVLTARPDESMNVDAIETAAKNLDQNAEAYKEPVTDKNNEKTKSQELGSNATPTDFKSLEANTPVTIEKSQKSKAGMHPLVRLVLSFVVVGGLLGGLVLFSKWYQTRMKKNDANTTIRVLTQHHLGPRKSLAIVRVAGESILLGVTDHNISMIKSLSLIDDEFAEVPTDAPFSKSLVNVDKNTEMKPEEEFVLSTIKDRLSTTLRGMRPF